MSPSAPLLTRGQLATAIVAVLAVVASVVALIVTVPPAVRASQPDVPVRAYLHALVVGDVPKALALARVTPTTADKLLTNAAYRQATERVSAFSVTGTTVDAGKAAVRVRVTQGDDSYVTAFDVERMPGSPLFAAWRLTPQTLPQVTFKLRTPAGLPFSVAGVPVSAAGESVTERVLPGSYGAQAKASADFTPSETRATASFAVLRPDPAVLAVELSNAGRAEAIAQADDWITQCAASTELAPKGCPFGAVPQDSATYSNGRWTIQAMPEISIGSWLSSYDGWVVTTGTLGAITYTADAREGNLVGTATTGSKPFKVEGTVVAESGTVRFVPSPAYSDGSTGALT